MEQQRPATAHADEYDSHADPLEAIYALNIGDFMAESFISDQLLDRISERLSEEPDRIKLQLEELVQIYSLDKTLGLLGFNANEGFVIFDSLAVTLRDMFQVDACHLLEKAHKENEAYLSLTGTSLELPGPNRWNVGFRLSGVMEPEQNILAQTANGTDSLVVNDVTTLRGWKPDARLQQQQVVSLLATPLKEGGKRLGLLVFEAYEKTVFSQELVTLAETAAEVFVTASRLQQLVAEAQLKITQPHLPAAELLNLRAHITESIADLAIHQQGFIEALAHAVDARLHYTRGHSKHVAHIAKTLAEAMALNEKSVDLIYYAGLLGAVGKFHIPQHVMSKREALSPQELDTLQQHPNVGVNLIMQIHVLAEVAPYVHYQNERWNGSGHPEGLSGRNIPLGSRILAVANAYHAMTQQRPYREHVLDHARAVQLIEEERGTKWDPAVVDALCSLTEADLSPF
ncbi:MAG: HD domain-containing phosphohydrolase [Candidatus Melainabacteria bacterium]|nr:HD domain-containing phosphohydrolase [Candidatus Melainabacteria bacterium]